MTFCDTIDNVARDLTKSFSTLWTPPGGERGAVGFFCAEAAEAGTPRVEEAAARPDRDRVPKQKSSASRPHRGDTASKDVKKGEEPQAGAKVGTLGGSKAKADKPEHQWGMPDTMIHSISIAEQKALVHQQIQQQGMQDEGNVGLINKWLDRQEQVESQLAGVPAHSRAKRVQKMGERTSQVRGALHKEAVGKESAAHQAAPVYVEFSALQTQVYKNVWKRTGVSPEEHSQVVRELQCRGRTEGEERQRLAVQACIMDKKLLKAVDTRKDFTVFRGGGVYGHGHDRKQISQAEAQFELQALNPWANRITTIAGVEIFR
uniref:Uncharacterized protein n=1 Tax=Hemiselmis andersenii TaxID=464988 RepID=A0A6T8H6L3_HEMAN|mmetsp:Transcript_59890/g.144345  ORF Transcript_59890/g.144345 Transcript_59890/m.144345 type:complete len:318 (+) Transcript_59890:71-1024(+)